MWMVLRIQWPSRRLTETRWQAFARAKGITKLKRSRLVWSDIARDWVPRWGGRSAHAREEAAFAAGGVIELPEKSSYLGRVGHSRGIKKLGRRVKKELWAAGSRSTSSRAQHPEGAELDPFASRKLRTAKQKLREVRTQLEAQAQGKRLPPGVLAALGKGGGSGKGDKTTSKGELSAWKKHRGQTKEELKEVLGRYDRLAKNEEKVQKASSKGTSTSLREERGTYLKQLKQVLHKSSSAV